MPGQCDFEEHQVLLLSVSQFRDSTVGNIWPTVINSLFAQRSLQRRFQQATPPPLTKGSVSPRATYPAP